MPKRKLTQAQLDEIICLCLDMQLLNDEIAEMYDVSAWLIGEVARAKLTEDQRKLRFSALASRSKQGNKNPMFGKVGRLHHNHVESSVDYLGYRRLNIDGRRVHEHIYVWEQQYQQPIPRGCVVHHIDMNKLNNSIDNLQLLTVGEHVKLHTQIRKVQRLLCTSQA